jgi:hypothetical protein
MTTTVVRSGAPVRPVGAPAHDLTDRQVTVFATVVAVVLVAALLALAAYGGPGIVAATTSFRDLTEAAFATLV